MEKSMTSRERVVAAVTGRPIDHVPVMVWLNPHTTCRLLAESQPARNKLASAVGTSIWKRFLRRGEMQADPLSRILPLILEEFGNSEYALELGSDMAILSPAFINPANFIPSIKRTNNTITVRGAFGGKMALAGIYMHPVEPAVSDPTGLAQLDLPMVTEKHFSGIRKFRKQHPHSCLLVEIGALQQILCDYILGSEAFMLALYDYPREIEVFMEKMGAWLENIIHLVANAGADIIFLQDDYGANGRPLISMQMWEHITMPQLARLVAAAHAHGLPFMLHSCGYQMPFLERYVHIGVDILQSFQIGAGNDLQQAYEITAGKLAFATGIDVQLAENASLLELHRLMLSAHEIGTQSGKFILAMTHMLQHTLSIEKYAAIFGFIRQLQQV